MSSTYCLNSVTIYVSVEGVQNVYLCFGKEGCPIRVLPNFVPLLECTRRAGAHTEFQPSPEGKGVRQRRLSRGCPSNGPDRHRRREALTLSPLLPSSLSPGRGKRGRGVGVRGLLEMLKACLCRQARELLTPETVKLRLPPRQSRRDSQKR